MSESSDFSAARKLYETYIKHAAEKFAKEFGFQPSQSHSRPMFFLSRFVPPDYTGLEHKIQINMYPNGEIRIFANIQAAHRNPRYKESLLIHYRLIFVFNGHLPQDALQIEEVLQRAKSICEETKEGDLMPFGSQEIPTVPIMGKAS